MSPTFSQWHAWPNECPSKDGKYLVALTDKRTFKRIFCVRTFRGKNWIFSCKTDIEYWMEIPKTPIEI